jgi:hypothetical protein
MNADIYTKSTLTVIAVALCLLVTQNFISGSSAQNNSLQKVQICDAHQCLFLSPIRKEASTGNKFLTFALPILVEQENR